MDIKKIAIVTAIFAFIIGYLLSCDFRDFKSRGANYYINNDDYNYSTEVHNLSKQLSHNDLFQGGIMLSDEHSLKLVDVEQGDNDKYRFYFVIDNENGEYQNGNIIYLYSFEQEEQNYDVELLVEDNTYIGELQSEGPFNKDGFYFSITFEDVNESILSEGTVVISFNNIICTYYERN